MVANSRCGFLFTTLVAGLLAHQAQATVICSSFVTRTVSDDLNGYDAAAIAEVVKVTPKKDDDGAIEVQFRISEVLKGKLSPGDTMHTAVTWIKIKQGEPMLAFVDMGDEPQWSLERNLSEAELQYVRQLTSLKNPKNELSFFFEYLSNSSEWIARDACDELSRVDFQEIKKLHDKMDRTAIVKTLENPKTGGSQKRILLQMLAVCGNSRDTALLERMRTDKEGKGFLDCVLGTYLLLDWRTALPLIERDYLENEECEIAPTYAAIMALRFAAAYGENTIPRNRQLNALRLVLDRPLLADVVIPDLTRMEDWTLVDRLAKMYHEGSEKDNWTRIPILGYLNACPLPEAKRHFQELSEADPKTHKRWKIFSP